MNKLVLISGLVAMSLGLISCKEVKIEDGRVPAQYLERAKAYEGRYVGQFDGRPGDLVLTFEGDVAVVRFENGTDNDLLGSMCQSSIGKLKSVSLKGRKNNRISAVTFAFDPNNCKFNVTGRSLTIGLEETNAGLILRPSLHAYDRYENRCTWDSGAPERGVPPREICRPESVPVYFSGKFKK
jgi:hypothetical protein